jgi:ribosomal protein S18 acetylase RimI-like enzyme
MDTFMTVESLDSKHRTQFEPILRSCIDETQIDLEQSIPHYLYSLGQSGGIIGFNIYGDPIGYVLYNRQQNKPVLLMHFWVHPKFRRQKVGARMMAHISRAEYPRPIMTILNETLLAAQLFLKSLGFVCTKIINSDELNNDQYQFIANSQNPMNRLAVYNPQIF